MGEINMKVSVNVLGMPEVCFDGQIKVFVTV